MLVTRLTRNRGRNESRTMTIVSLLKAEDMYSKSPNGTGCESDASGECHRLFLEAGSDSWLV